MHATKAGIEEETIELFCDEHSAYLIVLDPNGALYTNQAGGDLCAHPCARGFLVPLRGPSFEEDLHDWDWNALEELQSLWYAPDEYLALFSRFATQLPLPTGLTLVHPKDLPKLPLTSLCFGEAWLPVLIDPDAGALPYKGRYAILTYPNSD